MERVWVISLDKEYEDKVRSAVSRFLGRDVATYVVEREPYYPIHYVNGEASPDTSSGLFHPVDVYADVKPEEVLFFKNVADGGDLSWAMFWQDEFSKNDELHLSVGAYLCALNWEKDHCGLNYGPSSVHIPQDVDFSDIIRRYEQHTEFEIYGDNPLFTMERWNLTLGEYFDEYFKNCARVQLGTYSAFHNIGIDLTDDALNTLADGFKRECHRINAGADAPFGVERLWLEIIDGYVNRAYLNNMTGGLS